MEKAKPAASDGGHRVEISDFKPHLKNTLRAFFTAILPSGLVLHDVMLHERNGIRWISFPAREWLNAAGEKQYARCVEFRDRATSDRFRDQVLDALDAYLKEWPL